MSTKTFGTGAVLSAYTGYLVSDIDDLYEIIGHLAGGPVWTHQMPDAMDLDLAEPGQLPEQGGLERGPRRRSAVRSTARMGRAGLRHLRHRTPGRDRRGRLVPQPDHRPRRQDRSRSGHPVRGGRRWPRMTETVDIRSLWSQAAVGDVLPPHDDPPCCWPGPYGLECGRVEKHAGQHVATGRGVGLAVWGDVTAPSLDGRLRRLEIARLERAVRR